MRKAISASRALLEIWPPQVGPTKLRLTAEAGIPNSLASASCTLEPPLKPVTLVVCTCHSGGLPGGLVTWAVGSAPGKTDVTAWSTWSVVAVRDENVNTEPPLKSTL